jgi:aspartate ammonia-lyase
MSQSTNDVVPTAMKITALQLIDELILVYDEYQIGLTKKAKEFKNIIKVGRTHLQDAVPITLGQEFGAHASVVRRDRERLKKLKQTLLGVNLGGTAVGTAITASTEYIRVAVSYLAKKSGYELYCPSNLVDATQYADGFMEVSAMLTVLAGNAIKFMNDLRLLASGPRAGLGEITFTPRQKGSSIMPGKVNPVMAETVNQVCFQVIGNNQAIFMAVQAGQLELNVMLPIVARNLFESLTILKNGIRQFTKHALETISANTERCAELFNNSLVMSTALTPYLGYDIVATYVRKAINEDKSLKQVLVENKILSEVEYQNLIMSTME